MIFLDIRTDKSAIRTYGKFFIMAAESVIFLSLKVALLLRLNLFWLIASNIVTRHGQRNRVDPVQVPAQRSGASNQLQGVANLMHPIRIQHRRRASHEKIPS
jgi:hypothetical protein